MTVQLLHIFNPIHVPVDKKAFDTLIFVTSRRPDCKLCRIRRNHTVIRLQFSYTCVVEAQSETPSA